MSKSEEIQHRVSSLQFILRRVVLCIQKSEKTVFSSQFSFTRYEAFQGGL